MNGGKIRNRSRNDSDLCLRQPTDQKAICAVFLRERRKNLLCGRLFFRIGGFDLYGISAKLLPAFDLAVHYSISASFSGALVSC